MNIKIDSEILKELAYMVELHQRYGALAKMDSVESLVNYVLSSIADGSRRPGAWERQLVDMMGLVAGCDEHQHYREHYGK